MSLPPLCITGAIIHQQKWLVNNHGSAGGTSSPPFAAGCGDPADICLEIRFFLTLQAKRYRIIGSAIIYHYYIAN